jgi:hypothetical protein
MTAPDDLVERVARAICGKDWQECGSRCVSAGKCVNNGWTGCVDSARAAIAEVLKDWPEIERMRLGKQ